LLKKHIKTFNEQEILYFLKEGWEKQSKPQIADLSSSLIFAVGNLDEVYFFSKNQSPDISPDEFYRNSKKITLSNVKMALLRRFRSEQIARLGNNHIIYPALNSNAFRSVILLELEKLSTIYLSKCGFEIKFHPSVVKWIFSEGVVPTQGVRPLISTIRYSIGDQLPKIIADASLLNITLDSLYIEYDSCLKVKFLKQDEIIQELEYSLFEKVNPHKIGRGDDLQAIAAVHEAGHAITYMKLFKEYPEQVFSVAADSNANGMVIIKTLEFINVDLMKKRSSLLLAGYEAEALIFGEDLVMDGSSDDIAKATEMVMELVKGGGFGKELIKVAASSVDYAEAYHEVKEYENLVKEIISATRIEARKILETEKELLIQMARVLADKPSLNSSEIKQMAEEYGSEELLESLNEKRIGYREMLFSAIHHQNHLEEKLN
jgi:cell division protease FtsH